MNADNSTFVNSQPPMDASPGRFSGQQPGQPPIAAFPFFTAFPYIVGCIIIALFIGLFNLGWTIRHNLRIKRFNIFNIGLVACTLAFLVNVSAFLVPQLVKRSFKLSHQQPSDEFIGTFSKIYLLVTRTSWAIATLTYLMLVQSRFNLITTTRNSRFYGTMLIFTSILLWIPFGVIGTLYLLFNPMLDAQNPGLSSLISNYNIFWDFYFVLIDFILGSLTLIFIVKSNANLSNDAKLSSTKLISRSNDTQEQKIISSISRNVLLWLATGFIWISIDLIKIFDWGVDPESIKNSHNLLEAIQLIPSALEFTFGFILLDNIRSLFEVRGPAMTRSPTSPSVMNSSYQSPLSSARPPSHFSRTNPNRPPLKISTNIH